MLRHAAELGLAAAVLTNPPAAAAVDSSEAGAPDLKFSGYYKNLLINSETVFPAGERYTLDLNRLRLQLNGRVTKDVAVDVQYDNEILLGSYIRTAQFRLQKNQPSDEYWRTERNYIEGGSYYGRQRLYRGSVTFSSGETDIRIGRQRIAWGTGRFWSPLDILNPFNPIQLERDERVGVDAVLAEYKGPCHA